LVVDDFKPNLDVAAGLLGKYKLGVDCVYSGFEAIERIRLEKPKYDAVFMDSRMPDMDGLEATRLIREIGSDYAKNLPVIAFAASAFTENEKTLLEGGFNDFLPKPISVIRLDTIIRKWIKSADRRADEGEKSADPGKASETPEKTSETQGERSGASRAVVIEIPGIDTKLGLLLYAGDLEIYMKILRSFAENITGVLDRLRNVSKETLHDYAIDIHAVKSGCATVGAKELSDKAVKLENMAASGDLKGILSHNDSFIKDMSKLSADIKEWLSHQ